MQAAYHSPAGAALQADERGLSALVRACACVGDRWSLPIVAALIDGPLRYGEIRERLPGLAPNILSARLRTLEQEGLLAAHLYSQRPQRFEYRLTPAGSQLGEATRTLTAWAHDREAGVAGRTHERCGTALERRWWCPTCGLAIDDDDDEGDGVLV